MHKFGFMNLVSDEVSADIYIEGEIVCDDVKELYDYFGIEGVTSPGDLKSWLQENEGKPLMVHVNSRGGDLIAGQAMYSLLINRKGKTSGVVDGIAASASTLPLMACGVIKMNAMSMLMIHNASMGTFGNKNDMAKDIETLKAFDNSIINAYQFKTGRNREELQALMDNETWMDSREAKRLGFADVIDDELDIPSGLVTNMINSGKIIYARSKKPAIIEDNTDYEAAQAEFDFMNIKLNMKEQL